MPMDIDQIRALSNDDMQAVNQLIQQQVDSDVALINQLGFYIVNSGGKRLRPLVSLLSAKACKYQGDKHIEIAAIVEFLHTATLLHDDLEAGVLDEGGQEGVLEGQAPSTGDGDRGPVVRRELMPWELGDPLVLDVGQQLRAIRAGRQA